MDQKEQTMGETKETVQAYANKHGLHAVFYKSNSGGALSGTTEVAYFADLAEASRYLRRYYHQDAWVISPDTKSLDFNNEPVRLGQIAMTVRGKQFGFVSKMWVDQTPEGPLHVLLLESLPGYPVVFSLNLKSTEVVMTPWYQIPSNKSSYEVVDGDMTLRVVGKSADEVISLLNCNPRNKVNPRKTNAKPRSKKSTATH